MEFRGRVDGAIANAYICSRTSHVRVDHEAVLRPQDVMLVDRNWTPLELIGFEIMARAFGQKFTWAISRHV